MWTCIACSKALWKGSRYVYLGPLEMPLRSHHQLPLPLRSAPKVTHFSGVFSQSDSLAISKRSWVWAWPPAAPPASQGVKAGGMGTMSRGIIWKPGKDQQKATLNNRSINLNGHWCICLVPCISSFICLWRMLWNNCLRNNTYSRRCLPNTSC